jgi:hypothetical protein
MKLHKFPTLFFLLFSLLLSASLHAQEDREDVVYLKDGSIYRGLIVEQIPGVSLKVETIGGNVFNVQIGDVVKITKEKKVMPAPEAAPAPEAHGGYRYHDDMPDMHYGRHYRYHYAMGDSGMRHERMEYHPRRRGYFNTVQLLIENLEGGGRLVNGYKFGRCGYLGVGIGADFIFKDMRGNSDYSGVYLPLYLYYGGDILKKRITPFYAIEAGYAARMNPHNNNNNFFPDGPFSAYSNPNITNVKGGIMGGAAFGVKFYSRHRVFFSISVHADFQRAENTYQNYVYDPAGNYYYTSSTKKHETLLIPGIRLGLGF